MKLKMKVMLEVVFFITVLMLCIVLSVAHAAGLTATVSWIPPTTYTDGTPLTGLIGYRIDAKPKSYTGSALTKSVGASVVTASFPGLICGDYDFNVYTLDKTASDPSNTAPYKTEVVCSNKPNPPTGATAS